MHFNFSSTLWAKTSEYYIGPPLLECSPPVKALSYYLQFNAEIGWTFNRQIFLRRWQRSLCEHGWIGRVKNGSDCQYILKTYRLWEQCTLHALCSWRNWDLAFSWLLVSWWSPFSGVLVHLFVLVQKLFCCNLVNSISCLVLDLLKVNLVFPLHKCHAIRAMLGPLSILRGSAFGVFIFICMVTDADPWHRVIGWLSYSPSAKSESLRQIILRIFKSVLRYILK